MSWIDDTLRELGRSMGLDSLAFDANGVVQLAFERTGTLGLERLEREILIYLRRPLSHPDAATLRRALSLCHYDENAPFCVQPALQADGQLLFALRIGHPEFQLPLIERALAFLDLLHNQVAS